MPTRASTVARVTRAEMKFSEVVNTGSILLRRGFTGSSGGGVFSSAPHSNGWSAGEILRIVSIMFFPRWPKSPPQASSTSHDNGNGVVPQSAKVVPEEAATGAADRWLTSPSTCCPLEPAHGTSAMFRWCLAQSSIVSFTELRLDRLTLSVNRTPKGRGSPVVIMCDVRARIRLGTFVAVEGSPGPPESKGRGAFFEALCHMRPPDAGSVQFPPHTRTVLLNEDNYPMMGFQSLRQVLVFGHPDPNSVPDEAIFRACRLAGLGEYWLDHLDYHTGKKGKALRAVQRASVVFARAMLADVDMIVVNRAEAVFNHEQRAAIYAGLRTWIDEGVAGLPPNKAIPNQILRRRTVFVSCHHSARPKECDTVIQLGAGSDGLGLEVVSKDLFDGTAKAHQGPS
eukprot:CAMPEP_0185792056 /NCGR_PEP_ID=MMETSP1174-20130828/158715_1 /TAXON_ID=35687 /ORGANISM="Dictyocha speculum, Strain CCMP1381" /LENGTH=396 /DNA_ID=CAMNT_0028487073 /DNA_START=837 /DNA_END=2027 /DNA_ORIENTATION=+